jgi:hypothetical protein
MKESPHLVTRGNQELPRSMRRKTMTASRQNGGDALVSKYRSQYEAAGAAHFAELIGLEHGVVRLSIDLAAGS